MWDSHACYKYVLLPIINKGSALYLWQPSIEQGGYSKKR